MAGAGCRSFKLGIPGLTWPARLTVTRMPARTVARKTNLEAPVSVALGGGNVCRGCRRAWTTQLEAALRVTPGPAVAPTGDAGEDRPPSGPGAPVPSAGGPGCARAADRVQQPSAPARGALREGVTGPQHGYSESASAGGRHGPGRQGISS